MMTELVYCVNRLEHIDEHWVERVDLSSPGGRCASLWSTESWKIGKVVLAGIVVAFKNRKSNYTVF